MQNRPKNIRDAFRFQAIPCRDLGSPFTARLCELAAERLDVDNAIGHRIFNWPGDVTPAGESVPLRFAGSLHALVIEGLSDELAQVYPPHDKAVDDDRLWRAVDSALVDHEDFLQQRLNSAPQTNEVRRASVLLPGFWTIAQKTPLPFVLSELGASMGLNLNFDKFRYRLGDQVWGDISSPVQLEADWKGNVVAAMPIRVQSRAGCDLNPLNPANNSDRNRLMSYIWPDQSVRITRIAAAIDLATSTGIKVEKSDAIAWLRQRLEENFGQAVHVIYHTIAWQYFPKDTQAEGEKLIEDAGKAATIDAPLAWLRFETDGRGAGAGLYLTQWPGGEEQYLARADFHGRWVEWLA